MWYQVCCRFAMIVLLSATAFAQSLEVDVHSPDLATQLEGVAHGEKVLLYGFSFDERRGVTPMNLERFDVFHPQAVMTVQTANGPRVVAAPNHLYFKGSVDGMDGSVAYLSQRENGEVRGLVSWLGRNWMIEERRDRNNEPQGLQQIEVTDAVVSDPYNCGIENLIRADEKAGTDRETEITHAPALPLTRMPTADYFATVAIETDFEFYNLFGNEQDALTYIGDLFGYISTIYQNDLGTALLVGDTNFWSTSSDPWEGTSTSCQLYEFGNYWNANNSATPRTISHFLSGKRTGGGIAWVGVLCRGAFNVNNVSCNGLDSSGTYGGDYGVSANLNGNFNASNPSMIWDVVVVAHEIGHNFNSPHTHCYNGVGGNAEPVDQCYSGQSGCYSGSTSLPCGQSGAGCGTIMSYCHLLSGGTSNIAPSFGLNHPHGVEPDRVPTRMRDHVVSRSSSNPTCLPEVCTAPSITAQSSSSTQCVGANITLSVTAEGSGLSYQWYKNGNEVAGATGATLVFNGIQSGDGGSYTCIITNSCGDATSTAIVVTVETGTQVTNQPAAQDLCAGATLELSVSVTGSGLTYQWQRNEQNIAGATSATYTKADVVTGDAGSYRCVISSASCGTLNTNAAIVSVGSTPAVQEHPQAATRCLGSEVGFSVIAEGGGLSYQWQKDGNDLAGEVQATLVLSNLTQADAGAYRCLVRNDCGSVLSSAGRLTLTEGTAITSQPQGAEVCAGDSATLTIAATGPNLTYQWQRDLESLAGETSATLSLSNIQGNNSYRCIVRSDCGIMLSDSVTVGLAQLPVITEEPTSQGVCVGETAQFRVAANSEADLRYQWRKNGQNMAGQNAALLDLGAVESDDAGSYYCVVWNSACGSVVTETVTLQVSATPEITSQPADVFGCLGDQVSMTVSATGASSYQWRKDGQALNGQTQATLNLDLQDFAQEGAYDCVIENTCGSVTTRVVNVSFDSAFDVVILTSSVAQGLTPAVLEGQVSCRTNDMSWLWQDFATGNVLSQNSLTLEMPFLYEQTSVVVLRVEDSGEGQVIRRYATVLVSEDDGYVDINGDGCNSMADLHVLADQWRASAENTPNGDNVIDVRDFLYIDTSDNCPQ